MKNTVWEVNHSDVVLRRKLGEDNVGVVWKGTWRQKEVAIKQLKLNLHKYDGIPEFESETKSMLSLRHPNIVHLLGATDPHIANQHTLLVMEWVDGGSLLDALHDEKLCRSVNEQQIAIDIAEGLLFIHSYKPAILHLKSSKVLIDRQASHAKARK